MSRKFPRFFCNVMRWRPTTQRPLAHLPYTSPDSAPKIRIFTKKLNFIFVRADLPLACSVRMGEKQASCCPQALALPRLGNLDPVRRIVERYSKHCRRQLLFFPIRDTYGDLGGALTGFARGSHGALDVGASSPVLQRCLYHNRRAAGFLGWKLDLRDRGDVW